MGGKTPSARSTDRSWGAERAPGVFAAGHLRAMPPFSPFHPLDQVHRTSSSPLDRPRLHPLTTGRGTCCFPLTSARVEGKPGGRSPCITR